VRQLATKGAVAHLIPATLPHPAGCLISAVNHQVFGDCRASVVPTDISDGVSSQPSTLSTGFPREGRLFTASAHAQTRRIRWCHTATAHLMDGENVTVRAANRTLAANGRPAIATSSASLGVRHCLTSNTGRGVRRAGGVCSAARRFASPEVYLLGGD
jgi:hypothetical protein